MSEIFQIYLAGASYFEEDEGAGWRNKAVQMFKTVVKDVDVQVRVFNPLDFFSYSEVKHQSDTQVKQYYMDQIKHSRIVLCNLDRSRTSPGTAQELQYAIDNKVPIISFCTDDNVYPWLKVDSQVVFSSMLQAVDYIVEYYLRQGRLKDE